VLTVDGKHLKNLDQHRFQSAAYNFTLPEDNILGENETKSISVADGFWVMLKPLPRGKHTIHFEGGPLDGSWLQDVTYTIFVK
jgi:hypothetical protein